MRFSAYANIRINAISMYVKKHCQGTMDPRVEFLLQVVTQILIELHLQNLEQVSFSKSQPNMDISIKVELPNIDRTKLQNLCQYSNS